MLKKYISIMLLIGVSLKASECPQLAPYCQSVECLTEEEFQAVKACSKTYNNLVVTNALRTSNLNVTSATQLTGPTNINGIVNITGTLLVNGDDVVAGLPNFGSFSNIDAVGAQGITLPITWSSDNGATTLASPANQGLVITSTGTGVINITNPGIYLYNFGIVLQGAGSVDDQVAQAALTLTPYGGSPSPISPTGVTTLTIPGNNDPNVMFTAEPYELTSSGLFVVPETSGSPAGTLLLSLNLSSSWEMPEAGNGANAYITLIQVN